MTKASKVVLAVYFFFLALVTIIVPWKVNQAIAQGTVLVNSIGYAPIWSVRAVSTNYEAVTVDSGRVILEIVALTALFAIPFIFTLKNEDYEYVELEDFQEGREEGKEESGEKDQV
uniref:Uncharacterized protein n=1 Tax=Caldisericum exile TaxID=693075 RepID=A0A7C4XTE7_9BACT